MAQSGVSDRLRSMIRSTMQRGASWDVRSHMKSEPLIFTLVGGVTWRDRIHRMRFNLDR